MRNIVKRCSRRWRTNDAPSLQDTTHTPESLEEAILGQGDSETKLCTGASYRELAVNDFLTSPTEISKPMHGTMHRLLSSFISRWAVMVLACTLGLSLGAAPAFAQTGEEMSIEEKKKMRQELQQIYGQGAKAAKAENYEEAIPRFKEALQMAQENQEPLELGDNLIRQIEQSLVTSLKGAASAAMDNENSSAAVSHYNAALEYTEDDPTVYFNRGIAYLSMDSTDTGLGSLQEAMQIGNEIGNTRVANRAAERIRDEFLAQASQALQSDNPSQAEINTALEALDEMNEYVDPNADALFYRAMALFEDGQLEQAIQTANEGLEMHQGSRSDAAKFYFVIAESQMQLGNEADACQTFENAAYGDYEARAEHYLENECDDV